MLTLASASARKICAAVPGRPVMNAIGYWEDEPSGVVAGRLPSREKYEDLVATIGADQTIDAKPRPRCKPTHRAGLWRQSREVVHLEFCADAEGDVAAFSLLPEDGDARRAVATGGIEVDERPFLALAKAR